MNKKAEAHPAGKARSGSARSEDIHNITDARTGQTDDMHQRMVKYAVAMGIRLVCLLLIFVLDGWLKIIAVAGAVFLPWVAVVIANGGSDIVNEHSDALLDAAPLAELEAPRSAAQAGSGQADDGRRDAESPVTVPGEVIDDDGVPGTGGGWRFSGTDGGGPYRGGTMNDGTRNKGGMNDGGMNDGGMDDGPVNNGLVNDGHANNETEDAVDPDIGGGKP